jgi:hypothetical protein
MDFCFTPVSKKTGKTIKMQKYSISYLKFLFPNHQILNMKTFKSLNFYVLIFISMLLASCGKSPESAAKEVCDCMKKTTQSQGIEGMAGNAAECQALTEDYRNDFSPEELNTFTQELMDCTMGS